MYYASTYRVFAKESYLVFQSHLSATLNEYDDFGRNHANNFCTDIYRGHLCQILEIWVDPCLQERSEAFGPNFKPLSGHISEMTQCHDLKFGFQVGLTCLRNSPNI